MRWVLYLIPVYASYLDTLLIFLIGAAPLKGILLISSEEFITTTY